jgi:hypothetical protein
MRRLLLSSFAAMALAACQSGYTPPSTPKDSKPVVPSETDPERDYGRQGRGALSSSQLFESMKKLTGIDNHQGLQNYFNQQSPTLPQSSEASKLSASHFNAIANLAAEFCTVLLDVATHRNRFFEGTELLTFSGPKTPANLFSNDDQKRVWAEFFLSAFSASAAFDIKNHEAEVSVMMQLMNDLRAELLSNENSEADTRRILKHLCVAALASPRLSLN